MFTRLRKKLKGKLVGDTRVAIWDAHRLLYVRIPKNGNTSIVRAIEGASLCRLSSKEIARKADGWTTFSFVRNPWSRLVSTYRQKASADATSERMVDGVYHGFVELRIPVRAGMSFEEFCEVVCDIPDHRTDKHLQSQSHFLIRNGEAIVPFIGKVEEMDADWKKVMDRVGLANEIPHLNRTRRKHEHYSEFYRDRALINLVADRYAEDIRHFDYDFQRR